MTRTALLAAAVLLTGCTSLTNSAARTLSGKFTKTPRPHAGELAEVLTLWQPGEGRTADGLPSRGFAGQILFFKPGSADPTAVDADIVVYVFDDAGDDTEQREPLHRFHFSSEALQKYLRPSEVGVGYQLFLPYTREGDHHAVCSLRVVAQPRSGSRIMSPAADVTLHGRRETEVLRPADWTRESIEPADRMTPRQKLNVYSIPLPTKRPEARR